MRRGRKGFTLIELLIVLVILSILAGIVIISVGGIIDRGRLTACEVDRESVTTAVLSYWSVDGAWPVTEDTEDINFDLLLIAPEGEMPYLDEMPPSDTECDWQVDPQGHVYSETPETCPCEEVEE